MLVEFTDVIEQETVISVLQNYIEKVQADGGTVGYSIVEFTGFAIQDLQSDTPSCLVELPDSTIPGILIRLEACIDDEELEDDDPVCTFKARLQKKYQAVQNSVQDDHNNETVAQAALVQVVQSDDENNVVSIVLTPLLAAYLVHTSVFIRACTMNHTHELLTKFANMNSNVFGMIQSRANLYTVTLTMTPAMCRFFKNLIEVTFSGMSIKADLTAPVTYLYTQLGASPQEIATLTQTPIVVNTES